MISCLLIKVALILANHHRLRSKVEVAESSRRVSLADGGKILHIPWAILFSVLAFRFLVELRDTQDE
jgi:hypothetical protein